MTYYDYVTQFEGIEHPFGDLAADVIREVKSSKDPDKLMDIFEGTSFSDIYDHFLALSVSQGCINTFIESWAAYLQHEGEALDDPLPALILYQLSQLNEGKECLPEINASLRKISVSLANMNRIFTQLVTADGNNSFFRIAGCVDTYEQN